MHKADNTTNLTIENAGFSDLSLILLRTSLLGPVSPMCSLTSRAWLLNWHLEGENGLEFDNLRF